ncbi:MAG: homoserine kinase [Ignisphaera sp.]
MRDDAAKHVIVKAPGSIANLGPGFDILAIAISGLYDVVEISSTTGNGSIHVTSEGFNVPSGAQNVAYAVAKGFMEKYRIRDVDLYIRVIKGIPPASGLGSSGATSAATAFALSKLFGLNLSDGELLYLSGLGEAYATGSPHYDNVAASLFGGFIIVDINKNRVYSFRPHMKFNIAIVVPKLHELTSGKKTGYARSLLPKQIDLDMHTRQSSSLAKLIYALFSSDVELFGEAVSTDFVVEPYRAKMIPYYYELKKLAFEYGALGFNISGAGPSVFSIHRTSEEARYVGKKLMEFLINKGVDCEYIVSHLSESGVEVIEVKTYG